MLYDRTTGHRIKEIEKLCELVHTELNLQDYNLKQCFLESIFCLENPTKSVAIVESEKSALIATHYMPEFIWLATGRNAWVF